MASAALLGVSAPAAGAPLLSARARPSTRDGVRNVQKLALDRAALAALRARDHAVVPSFPLGSRRTADLELARIEPFAPGARAEIMESDGPRRLTLPDRVYFAGSVAGEEGSRVFLAAGRDRVHGFVVSDGDVYPFGPDGKGGHRGYALRDVDPTRYPPPGDFCANDLEPELVNVPAALPEALAVPPLADAPGTQKQADVAIETDQELRAKFGSDTAALDYLSSLAAAATAVYERDVAVRLRFSYIRLWGASSPDPWSATSTSASLSELRTYWNNAANGMSALAGPRTVVHFVSGKNVQGGIAYLDVLCNASYGYGVSQVYGSFDLSRPSQIWDVMVFTHELGHNFGSPHSHCYSPPIDRCYNQEAGCYSGSVVASRGTIMSYCHLLAGGLSNIDLVFGGVVSAEIGQSVAAASCLATVSASTTTTTAAPTTTTTTTSSTSTSSTTTTVAPTTTTTTRPSTTTTTSTSSTSTTTTTQVSTTTTTSTSSTTTTSTSSTTSTSTTTTTRPSTTTTSTTSTSTTLRPTTTTSVPSTTTTRPPATTTTTLPERAAGDADGDGVTDVADACAATPAGDLVDPSGCSVCPCDGPPGLGVWAARSEYVGCVRAEARRRAAQGLIGRRARRNAVVGARRSTCGRAGTTRCCLYEGPEDATGRCRVLQTTGCEVRLLTLDGIDLGAGSCVPSPCAR